jgi:hypothetical protein
MSTNDRVSREFSSLVAPEQDGPIVGDSRARQLPSPSAPGVGASLDERPPFASDLAERRTAATDRTYRLLGFDLVPVPADRRRTILKNRAPPGLAIDPAAGPIRRLTPAATLIIGISRAAAAMTHVEA